MHKSTNRSFLTGIIFSKDRALQLDATLRSFSSHCHDLNSISLKIIYTTSSPYLENQYQQLSLDYKYCEFIRQSNFKNDLITLLQTAEYILFLVDDNIFCRDFNLNEIIRHLQNKSDTLAFSLRLGRNTRHFYMRNIPQAIPDFTQISSNILQFNWTDAEGDFGFPLEVSSSIYRTEDLRPIVQRLQFHDPNTLELKLSQHKYIFQQLASRFLCYENSITFCNPINIVNTSCICRAGNRQDYSSPALAQLFEQGLRINTSNFNDFVPAACHQEVELEFYQPLTKLKRLSKTILTSSEDELSAALQLKSAFQKIGLQDNADQVFANYLKRHPEDQEVIEAIIWWEKCRTTNVQVKIPSISIIIPAYNCASTITETLNSVITALEFNERITGANEAEIVVVNDNSTDTTAQTVQLYQKSCAKLFLLNNSENMGAGPARNFGTRKAQGELIFFLDGDDLFFREHIFLCLHQMVKNDMLHFVQTGIRIDEEILPYWKNAIENSVPFNLCVRRWCHDCLGGYPEDKAFVSLRCEDAFYRTLLTKYFIGCKLKRETMQHFRYPGNALDRQMEKFSRPPDQTSQAQTMNQEELEALPEIQKIMLAKRSALEQSLRNWHRKLTCPSGLGE